VKSIPQRADPDGEIDLLNRWELAKNDRKKTIFARKKSLNGSGGSEKSPGGRGRWCEEKRTNMPNRAHTMNQKT